MHLVESSLWTVIVAFLAAFDIKKPVDDQGNVVEPPIVFDNPIIRCVPGSFAHNANLVAADLCALLLPCNCYGNRTPNPFPCDIKPRSPRHAELIQQDVSSA